MRPLRPGEVLDRRYKIEALIGAGGMGDVYSARRTRLGDVVAIKIIHTRSGDAAKRRKQFLAEAQLCAMLHHPHIVSVLDFGVESSVGGYLVMEFLNGPSLKQQLDTQGPFDFAEVCRVLSQVASALDLAHSQGVVHRDLKPGNVMTHRYTTGEVVYKVIDFGIGALHGPKSSHMSTGAVALSGHEDRVLLTVAYASPEQLSGDDATPRSDIYSLGVTVYELLTGRRPCAAPKAGSMVDAGVGEPLAPAQRGAGIPPAAEAAVLKALSKDPESRWRSAGDFARALGSAPSPPVSDVAASSSRLRDMYDVDLSAPIGRGRLGSAIYRGTHRATGHAVAIRVMRREKTAQWDTARTRFLREARVTPVNHPSILRVRDYGEEMDQVYVVTDFVPGFSLREKLDRNGAFLWARGRFLLADLISATRALHTRGLLVFGLSPSIIRLTSDGDRERLVISLAGAVDIREVLPRDEPTRKRASINEDAFYLAPELLIGEKPDGRTDIFMIGAIGYELFTGRRPFTARTLEQLVTAAFSDEIADPRVHAPSLPVDAALCLVRCLARRPDRRFSDVIELASAWEKVHH